MSLVSSHKLFLLVASLKNKIFSAVSSISSSLSLACSFKVYHKFANATAPQKCHEMEIHFFAVSYDNHMRWLRLHAYTYNPSRIQFSLQNDSADAIEVDCEWIQTRSVNSH